MLDEGKLLAALGRVLGADPGSTTPRELVVVRRALRRRSTIYFVGDAASGSNVISWVLKCPSLDAERPGIRPPMTPAEQYSALERLHEFLADRGGRFAAPRPVALLPAFGGLAMDFVEGRSLWELVAAPALWRPQELCEGVRSAALALRHLHTIEPAGVEAVNLTELEGAVFRESLEALHSISANVRDTWLLPSREVHVSGKVVLLHGDWAPENVLLTHEKVFLLDPELTDRGWPEHDLARFLLMLWDRSLFVVTDAVCRRALRHDLTRVFLSSYYGSEPVSPLLRPLLLREVSQRWTARHQDAQRGGPTSRRARSRLLSNYFGAVLDEVSDPRWTESAIR